MPSLAAMNRRASILVAALIAATTVVATAGPAQALGGGFLRASAVCPAGKVVIGGGAQVVGEGSADFLTVMQETAPSTSGGTTNLWTTAMKNNDLFASHTIGLFAVCATSPLTGHQIVQRTVTVGAHSFVRTTVSCPAGRVSLSGGAQVVGEGAADFKTVIRESSPGDSPSSSLWLAAVANTDSSSHTVAVTAVCATAPAGYQIVREDHALLGDSFLRDTTACPSGRVAIGGGVQVVGDGSADFGTKLQESAPTGAPSATSWLTALRNGPGGHTVATFTVCANAPAGYQIVQRNVGIS